MGVVDGRCEPEAGKDAVEMRGSNRHRSAPSAPFDEKYVFWQHVARFVAAADAGGGAVDVLATGGGHGEVEDRTDGGGNDRDGAKSGSSGACVCSRVLITSNGVTTACGRSAIWWCERHRSMPLLSARGNDVTARHRVRRRAHQLCSAARSTPTRPPPRLAAYRVLPVHPRARRRSPTDDRDRHDSFPRRCSSPSSPRLRRTNSLVKLVTTAPVDAAMTLLRSVTVRRRLPGPARRSEWCRGSSSSSEMAFANTDIRRGECDARSWWREADGAFGDRAWNFFDRRTKADGERRRSDGKDRVGAGSRDGDVCTCRIE